MKKNKTIDIISSFIMLASYLFLIIGVIKNINIIIILGFIFFVVTFIYEFIKSYIAKKMFKSRILDTIIVTVVAFAFNMYSYMTIGLILLVTLLIYNLLLKRINTFNIKGISKE